MDRTAAERKTQDVAVEARKILHAELQNNESRCREATETLNELIRELRAINWYVEIWTIQRFFKDDTETSTRIIRRNYYKQECCGAVIKIIAFFDLTPTDKPNTGKLILDRERIHIKLNEACRNPKKHYQKKDAHPLEGVVDEKENLKYFGELGFIEDRENRKKDS